MPTYDKTLNDLMELLPIPGPPAGEGRVAAHIRDRLIELGLPSEQIVHDRATSRASMAARSAI